jgi:hypothetical protein
VPLTERRAGYAICRSAGKDRLAPQTMSGLQTADVGRAEKAGTAVPFAFDELQSIVADFKSPISVREPVVRYACALVAELAYHHVPWFEIDDKKRAMSVPCEQYRAIVVGGTATSVTVYLEEKDLPNFFVVVDRGIIAVGILLDKLLFIGFRGTTFLFDWRINLTAPVVEIGPGFLSNGPFLRHFSGGRAHRGFAEEAVRISAKIVDAIRESGMNDIDHFFLTGHSLGGAVAALAESFIGHGAISTCIFAAPRYCDVAAYYGLPSGPPTQIQRPGDIVPYVPPRSLGYADHPSQFSTAGQPFFEAISHSSWPFFLWRMALFLAKTFEPHSMEAYRRELGRTAGAKWANEPLAPYDKLGRPLRGFWTLSLETKKRTVGKN